MKLLRFSQRRHPKAHPLRPKHLAALTAVMLGSIFTLPALADPGPADPILTEQMRVSWYGPGFDGNATASGETFNRWGHTAAHPNWPFGTLVQLTNPSTGATVTVRINDRSGGMLDLAEQAAIDLGVHAQGIATVEVDILQWGEP